MKILLLIRHGENDVMSWGLAGRLPYVQLNERGRQQADLLGKHLQREKIYRIFSSPLERAMETAAPLAGSLDLPIEVHTGLNEIDYGQLQGWKYSDLHALEIWREMLEHPESVQFPGGESLQQAQERIVHALLEIRNLLDDHEIAACFTHGDVVRLGVLHTLGLPIQSIHQFQILPASVTAIAWNGAMTSLLFVNQIYMDGTLHPLLKLAQTGKEA